MTMEKERVLRVIQTTPGPSSLSAGLRQPSGVVCFSFGTRSRCEMSIVNLSRLLAKVVRALPCILRGVFVGRCNHVGVYGCDGTQASGDRG
jgi:hypothetical protein